MVETEIFPDVLVHMAHPDENVGRVAAILTREICKHTFEVNRRRDDFLQGKDQKWKRAFEMRFVVKDNLSCSHTY